MRLITLTVFKRLERMTSNVCSCSLKTNQQQDAELCNSEVSGYGSKLEDQITAVL